MKRSLHAALVLSLSILAACAGAPPGQPGADAAREVSAVERAFADTMAQRDHNAFEAFLSDDAVFLSEQQALRGKSAVADHWARYFVADRAPFSWAPETVEVLGSGGLALSTGPVWNSSGDRIATFTSIWRLENGVWRIVFDRGNRYCPPTPEE